MNRLRPRYLLLILGFISLSTTQAQQPIKNYESEWKKVDEFVKKGLPKSAFVEVGKIYLLAKKDAAAGSPQDAQVIKSLVYMSNLQSENQESNKDSTIKAMEREIAQSKEPVASILSSLLAGVYWSYFQANRWRLYDRTQTLNFKKDDIATWGPEDLHRKITELYLRSLKDEKLLQQTKLAAFDAIIIKGTVRHLRPTLYDVLAHRALEYFSNDERDIKKPAYAFEIDQASAFDPAADFITRKFTTKDSLSLQHKALLIYQKLVALHLKDARPDALIEVDLERIDFINNNSVHPDKDQLYFNAINHVAHQYENLPAASEAWFLIADYYDKKAGEYKAYGDTTHQFDRLKAKEICEKVLSQTDSSEGKINCYNLLIQINAPSLDFMVEKVNLPNQPFRVAVGYQNFSRLYLRIIRPDDKLKKDMANQYEDVYWKSIIAAKPLTSWDQELPATNDMQKHLVEIKIAALPVGQYLMVASTDKDFAGKKTVLGARLFYVSSISFVNEGEDYFVLNRDSGQPLVGATVQSWERIYDYKTSDYIKTKGKLYKTDNNGFFRRPRTKSDDYENSFYLDISYSNDRLFLDEEMDTYYGYVQEPSTNEKEIDRYTFTYLFTDRSIYRPGQTVYFKGISIVWGKDDKRAIRDHYKTRVYLYNANSQMIDSLNVQTNEYGSFSGKFQLPQGVLNGSFRLSMTLNRGQQDFRVEEYKRPKFYVDYEPIKGTYKVNDKINISGIAKAYAGNNIDGATVKYRVVREARFLYSWLYWRWWQPPTAQMEIAHGEIKTDKEGKFAVEFTAIPDLKIDKAFEPIFDYTVYADVTDINGETRSGEQLVSVGYKGLLLKLDIPESLATDSLKSISLRTENMNGEFEPANVTITITKLKEETRLIRERFWGRPDQFVMSKDEYVRNFPNDEYNNESDYRSWERDLSSASAEQRDDSSHISGKWSIINSQWKPGHYVAEVTATSKNGEQVKDLRYFELFDEKTGQLSSTKYIRTRGPNIIEPGEKTSIALESSANDLFVIQQVQKQPGAGSEQPRASSYSFIKLNNERKIFEFGATEADRGGYGVSYCFVKHNRFYQSNHTIAVPWSNKELMIEYATFRDKTLPGSEEKWKVKLTGYKKEKVAAEVLASMYDASLDQFSPHSWNKPGIWSLYYNDRGWEASENFAPALSDQKDPDLVASKIIWKIFDELNGIGGSSRRLILRGDSWKNVGNYLSTEIRELDKKDFRSEGLVSYQFTTAKAISESNSLKVTAGVGAFANAARPPSDSVDFLSASISPKPESQGKEVQIRKNFNETAFFFPDLRTDSTGAIEFSFTLPEALTKWKFQALAHTKDLAFGYSSKEIVTQKQLMVQPNTPRFLREGDKIELSAKIANLTDKEVTGQAELQLFDAATNQPVDGRFKNSIANQYFTVAAGQSEAIKFPIEVPYQFNKALTWRITAKASPSSLSTLGAGQGEDGEEDALPVLTNRTLVTETMPLNMRNAGTKNFKFDKLLNSGNSETLQHHALIVEYTSNPAWYAVQALPYLMEYPYECAEQTWNRYYANSLAAMIANSSPRIKQIFEQWKNLDTSALLSNLQKNEELKTVLLEETPWVLQAKTESEQKRNIALLFDLVKLGNQLNGSYEKLKQMQSSNGGFVWFKGGPDDRYITQYIISSIGHLKRLRAIGTNQDAKLKAILALAIPYLDKKIEEDYAEELKYKSNLIKYIPSSFVIQYLYMRSFFPEYKITASSQAAYNYFRERAQKTWTFQSKYMQGMLALALSRTGDAVIPAAILKSLKETAINNEELGMYWKDANRGWWWYEAPIERQALLIEAFQEVGKDQKTVNDVRTWLLKNKQTNSWESTKATADACYALLLQGSQWLNDEPTVTIQLGNTKISATDNKQEAGTGYFKKVIEGENITPEMGDIAVTVGSFQTTTSATWGAVYWQYFEDLDKITTSSTPLKVVKKLFVEKNGDRGPELTPVNDGDVLKVGDKIKVRIELRVDRDMEYVHMKDMRAAAMEPVNVLSDYKWQGGLGYYESTKDASTNFFFGSLRKGTYVFEYPLFVTHEGNFSNGISTIQCMYAPEFTSHSDGIRINVE